MELQILLEQKQPPLAQNRDSGCYSEARAASPPPPPQHSQNQDSGRYSKARAASPPPQPMLLTPPALLYSEAAERRPPAVYRGRSQGRG
ncbi:MAG: hypothetical protein GY854_20245 [Deltaproteobacteria bacterium]|nr:hypothetical protein [Deltaproteobacteria bacterium]